MMLRENSLDGLRCAQMLNNESPARTVADTITKDENMQVSQHSSKPNVSCSTSIVETVNSSQ
jgi:hypothetical protein